MVSKLAEAILYVADKSKDHRSFGMTKLNKILFYADFVQYGRTESSITAAQYYHENHGPAAPEIVSAIKELEREKAAKVVKGRFAGQKRLKPLREPDTSLFTDGELAVLSGTVDMLRSMSASQVREWSHTLNPWEITEHGEAIPYYLVYVMKSLPVESAAFEWADRELEHLRAEGHSDV